MFRCKFPLSYVTMVAVHDIVMDQSALFKIQCISLHRQNPFTRFVGDDVKKGKVREGKERN